MRPARPACAGRPGLQPDEGQACRPGRSAGQRPPRRARPCFWTRSTAPPSAARSPSWSARATPSWPRRCPKPGASTRTGPPAPMPGPADAPVLNAVAGWPRSRASAKPWPGPCAETGLDMSRFPTAPTWCLGWAVPLSPPVRPPYPGREERPGRHLAARVPRPGRHRRRPHRHLPQRAVLPDRPPPWQGQGPGRGGPVNLLVIIWHLLKDPRPGSPTSATATAGHADVNRKLRNHIRQIQALGFEVALTKARNPHTVLAGPITTPGPGPAARQPISREGIARSAG